MPLGNCRDPLHVGSAAVELSGHDGRRAFGDAVLDVARIDQVIRPDLHEHRPCADRHNRRRARHESVRRQQHLVSGPHAGHLQVQFQSVGSIGDTHGVANSAILRQPFLELAKLLLHDVRASSGCSEQRLLDVYLMLIVYVRIPKERDLHVCLPLGKVFLARVAL